MKTAWILLVCLLLSSCRGTADSGQPAVEQIVRAQVLSVSTMHDNYSSGPHEMNQVVKYRILGPPELAGREITVFHLMDGQTNTTLIVGATVDVGVVETPLEQDKTESKP